MTRPPFCNLIILITWTLLFGFVPMAQASTDCVRTLTGSETERTHISQAESEAEAKAKAEAAGHESATQVERILENRELKRFATRGYGILIGTMVGSAVLTTYLSAHLPPELQFTSIFIAQVSTLGVYVLGAPIWEPISSKFRKWAFGLGKESVHSAHSSPQLEATWTRTQEKYSLNAQMSRNIISQFIFTVKENFYQAYRAHSENNPIYAADQIAEAAYRMRILFRDIDPADASVARAISTAFTNHITIDPQFIELVWSRIKSIDQETSLPHVHLYYETILNTWLEQKHTSIAQ